MKKSSCIGVYFCSYIDGPQTALEFSNLVSHTKESGIRQVICYKPVIPCWIYMDLHMDQQIKEYIT
jgi:hypothetical protein